MKEIYYNTDNKKYKEAINEIKKKLYLKMNEVIKKEDDKYKEFRKCFNEFMKKNIDEEIKENCETKHMNKLGRNLRKMNFYETELIEEVILKHNLSLEEEECEEEEEEKEINYAMIKKIYESEINNLYEMKRNLENEKKRIENLNEDEITGDN